MLSSTLAESLVERSFASGWRRIIVFVLNSLLTGRSVTLNVVVFLTRSRLLLEPLSGQVGISSEAPVVVVIDSEGVHVPADEEEDDVDEATVDHIGALHADQFHPSEHLVQLHSPAKRLFRVHDFQFSFVAQTLIN